MPPTGSKNAPEAKAREKIDALLDEGGWAVQDPDAMNLKVPAVADRESNSKRATASPTPCVLLLVTTLRLAAPLVEVCSLPR